LHARNHNSLFSLQQAPRQQSSALMSRYGSRVPRPFGVWLLTLYAIIAAGVMPLVMLAVQSGTTDVSPLQMAFSGILAVAIIVAGGGAWAGNRGAMLALLVLITLHYGLMGLQFLLLYLSGEATQPDSLVLGRAARGILYPLVYIWYFNTGRAKAFYGRP
jgi:hypothetical protein